MHLNDHDTDDSDMKMMVIMEIFLKFLFKAESGYYDQLLHPSFST